MEGCVRSDLVDNETEGVQFSLRFESEAEITLILTSFDFGSNQCVMSEPAALMIGSHSAP